MAITVDFLTGWEHGLKSVLGGGLFSAAGGLASVQSSGARTGNYCGRVAPAATTTGYFRQTCAASQQKHVSRIAFKVITLTGTNTVVVLTHVLVSVGNLRFEVRNSDGKIYGLFRSTSDQTAQAGPVVTDGAWHVLEAQADTSGTTFTCDWKVDGVSQTQITWAAGAAADLIFWEMGSGQFAGSGTVDLDDFIAGFWTNAGTDWFGDGGITGVAPTVDGTHNTGGTNFINGDTATTPNFTNSTINANTFVDDIAAAAWSETRSTTDNISAEVHTAGAYMEVKPGSGSAYPGGTATAVRALLSYSAPGTQANSAACESVNSDGTRQTIWGTINGTGADYSESSNNFKGVIMTVPSGGFTEANFENSAIRMGLPSGAGDVSPRPTWQAVMWEVDIPAAGATPISGTDTATSTENAVVVQSYSGTDTGSGSENATETATLPGSDASGTITETGSLPSLPVAAADTGSGADSGGVRVPIAGADSAAGTDASALHAAFSGSEEYGIAVYGVDFYTTDPTVVETDTATEASSERALFSGSEGYGSAEYGVDFYSSVPYVVEVGTDSEITALTALLFGTDADGTIVETGSVNVGGTSIAGSDSGSGTDSAAVLNAILAAAETATDSENATLTAVLAASDLSSVITESATYRFFLAATDSSSSVVDTAVLVFTVSGADSAAGSDSGAVNVPIAGSDSGTSTQTGALTALLSGSDSGAGSDTSLLIVVLTTQDTGSGSDTGAVLGGQAFISGTDSGVGADLVYILGKAVADAATGSDTISQMAKAALDTATGSDSGLISSRIIFGNDQNASADETVLVQALIAAAEAGTSAEAGSLSTLILKFGQEFGVGVDTAEATEKIIKVVQQVLSVGEAGGSLRKVKDASGQLLSAKEPNEPQITRVG